MCGIFGIITGNKSTIKREELANASALLSHRGPNMHDVYIDQNLGLSHYRLSIFDISEKAKQPMSAFGKTIVFNGAIYNFKELRESLEEKAYSFTSNSDTEVILAAYDAYGENCVNHFNGQWSFAIYDKENNTLFCSRDRFGIKPFYYRIHNERFCFSSEIKAFTGLDDWEAKLNPERAYEYLQFAMHDHTNETMFKDVLQLERGTNMHIDLDSLKISNNKYYSLSSIQVLDLSEAEAVERLGKLLANAINLRLRSDVKSATALSGGLDSSIIALRAANSLKQNYDAYSVVYKEEEYNESSYVNSVLKNPYLVGHSLSPGFSQFMENLDKLIWSQDEPFNGISVFAQNSLFENASKDNVRVMLDGQGADEIFAGYEKFYLPVFRKLLRTNPAKAFAMYKNAKESFPQIDAMKSILRYFKKNAQQGMEFIKLDLDQSRLFSRPTENSILTMSKNLLTNLGLSALLRYEDRNAMAHGIESRVPYLDHELVEFALTLPDSLKMNKGLSKWILRESNKDILPEVIYNRKDKLGFATPEKTWLLQHYDLIQDAIQKESIHLSPILNIDLLFQEKDMKKIFRVFIFSRWLRLFKLKLN